jgi:hypothetical protein
LKTISEGLSKAYSTPKTMEMVERLRKGVNVRESRRTGKTTALAIVAHEFMEARYSVCIVMPNSTMGSIFKHLWRELYGEDELPKLSSPFPHIGTSGYDRVLIDEPGLINFWDFPQRYWAAAGS